MSNENHKTNPYFSSGERHPNFGKTRTDEVKDKISQGASSEIVYKGVLYPSVKVAAVKLNVSEASIRQKLSREKDNPNFKYVEKRVSSRDYSYMRRPLIFNGVEYRTVVEVAPIIEKSETAVRKIMEKEISAGNPLYKYL